MGRDVVLVLIWLRALALRRAARLGGIAAGIAVGVALLASIGTFLAASKATMTARSVEHVAVDWQIEAQPGADAHALAATVRDQPGVREALQVGFAQTTGLSATSAGTTQTTGPGFVLGVPDGYRAAFPKAVRDLLGPGGSGGVLLAQQTAANLHAGPGDTVIVGRSGLPPVTVAVDGVVELPQADSLFQRVGAPQGAQPQAPPDNVMLLPQAQWHTLFDPLQAARPDLVRTQVHVRYDHALPPDPAAAYAAVTGAASNLEARLAGGGLVGDNLAATLAATRSDAVYAQVLFLFLGLPGAAVAALLTGAVASAGAERRRREQALLRIRGATARQLALLGAGEALVVGGLGAAAGLAGAAVVGRIAFGTATFGATRGATAAWAAGAALSGLAVAAAAVALPAWRDARRRTVAQARRMVGRGSGPRWQRAGLDLWLLAGSLVVFWLTARGGYTLVLAPEGTPAISVSYWAFGGPLFAWLGAGLLIWRLVDLGLRRGQPVLAALARPIAGALSGVVTAAMGRDRRPLNRSAVLLALTAAFAASTAVFNATYSQQAEVDAVLSNGADVTITESPGVAVGPSDADALSRVPGVASVEPLQHRFAYVGADLQDLYGVRPSTIVAAGRLQDTYFQGGTARDLIGVLAARPDAVLVSAETVRDFQLHPGDPLTLRLQDGRTKAFTDVPFHYAGVVREFPTAPSDSFLVANGDYVAAKTGTDAVGAFLVRTDGTDPATVAERLRAQLGTQATVTDIQTSRDVIASSLTAVDLSGLTTVELLFALLLAATAAGLVLLLSMVERRRTFAIASALGATPRQLGGFVWVEAAVVTGAGLLAGAVFGWALSQMLVKVLTGVFDPPPAVLAVPVAYLATVCAVVVVAVALAATTTIRVARRATIMALRDA